MAWPVQRWYQVRLRSSVAMPSCTIRLCAKLSGAISPRFSRHSRISSAASSPIMMRASEPPMKLRRSRSVDMVALLAFNADGDCHPPALPRRGLEVGQDGAEWDRVLQFGAAKVHRQN